MTRTRDGSFSTMAFAVFFVGLAAAGYLFPSGAPTRVACSLDPSGCWVGGPMRHLSLRLAVLAVSWIVAIGLWVAGRGRTRRGRSKRTSPDRGRPFRHDRRRPTLSGDQPVVRLGLPTGRVRRGGTRVER